MSVPRLREFGTRSVIRIGVSVAWVLPLVLPAFGRALTVIGWRCERARGGAGVWGQRIHTYTRLQGVGPLLSVALTRPTLYGLPFLFLLWHRRRSPPACRMFDRYRCYGTVRCEYESFNSVSFKTLKWSVPSPLGVVSRRALSEHESGGHGRRGRERRARGFH